MVPTEDEIPIDFIDVSMGIIEINIPDGDEHRVIEIPRERVKMVIPLINFNNSVYAFDIILNESKVKMKIVISLNECE